MSCRSCLTPIQILGYATVWSYILIVYLSW